jgi:hypothetical protein
MIIFDTNVNKINATTQYLNFDFDSLCKFKNKFFCAGNDGLFIMEGTTDMFPSNDGTYNNITSYFELKTLDFGISNQKRFRALYFGYEADGDLIVKISTELSKEESYTLSATSTGQQARKLIINRTLKGRYWTIQIYSSGTVFAIDNISILPIVRSHGFDKN